MARVIEHCRRCGVRRVMWNYHNGTLMCKECYENASTSE